MLTFDTIPDIYVIYLIGINELYMTPYLRREGLHILYLRKLVLYYYMYQVLHLSFL